MSKQQYSPFNHQKYRPFPMVLLPQRHWPNRQITQAPQWCSVDLRDGNQALINPLSITQKLAFFNLLVNIGFKEIEIGFPSASQTDFDFARLLIEQRHIPDDVKISVLTPARKELIERSFTALKGAKQAIVHLYNSTSTLQRERVFKLDKASITALAVNGAKNMLQCAKAQAETQWTFQYSPESFSATELDYAVEICEAVCAVWQPTPTHPVIINLPSTVEMATPNVYADQIEWFSTHIDQREAIILSVHTHNDRGCAIAAAELALMAGAQRVEGTLLGNGERTGNMDVVIMAMNLYSQGIDPQLDFANMGTIAQQVSQFNQIAIHPRHPYVGDLVFTAFSGSHQDAIKKCLSVAHVGEPWQVAYLPIDPADIGRSYQEMIRVNSQSGKAGACFWVEHALNLQLPRWLQSDFSQLVQQNTEIAGCEISAQDLVELFRSTYLDRPAPYQLINFEIQQGEHHIVSARLLSDTGEIAIKGQGNGVLAAFINGVQTQFGVRLNIIEYHEHALSAGTDAKAASYIRLQYNGASQIGIALHQDCVSASLNAVLQALGN